MKKFGFTLSEIIITLGIIGIVAAITAPMIDGIMPDKNKAMVLKYYKIINDITTELLNNPAIYRNVNCDNTGGPEGICRGLGFTNRPLVAPYKDNEKYSGINKYGYLLASKLELAVDAHESDGQVVFTTTDGLEWFVKNFAGGNIIYTDDFGLDYRIIIDVNEAEAPNSIYSNNMASKTPDRFSFDVSYNGKVTGYDPLTKAYLENPYKLNDKKKDYARAKELSSN